MTIQNPDIYGFTEGFTGPFRYVPHPLVRKAAEIVMKRVQMLDARIRASFDEGKMLGVLVVGVPVEIADFTDWLDEGRRIGFIAGFSGSVSGLSHIEGFVPPVFDLMDPEGHYKQQEKKITDLNDVITELQNASEFYDFKKMLWLTEGERESKLMVMRERMAASKKDRDRRRAEGCDPEILIKESQHEKAEFRRLKAAYEKRLEYIRTELRGFQHEIDKRKHLRAAMSDALQEWLFNHYIVHNFLGEESSILDIFASQDLTPPGGTGECAAPKLLEHAYRTGLEPLAMGEFWYGTSPDTAVRTHGHFYPSCTSKCGPLLGYMLKGLQIEDGGTADIPEPVIIYEDKSIIVVSKPSGMPSVPGLDGKVSLQEWLIGKYGEQSVHAVHRLDMDTSGVIVFAKSPEAGVNLRKQFEEHTVQKTYKARLSAPDTLYARILNKGDKGRIVLSIGHDYDERPRQKVDPTHGKPAVTDYEVAESYPDGTTDIIFHPVTGRTHQLRVHSAHASGLCRPILGDLLYGGHSICSHGEKRLHLHALSITLKHPVSEEIINFTSDIFQYQ